MPSALAPHIAPSEPLTLRERTRLAMRAEVIEVAFRLFTEQGFEQTTVEQIAAEAGLSRTTFFRYFGTKEELVLGRISELGLKIAAALRARPETEHPWVALRRAFDVVTEFDTTNAGEHQKFMRLLDDACRVRTQEWERTQGWQSVLAPETSRRLGLAADPAAPQGAALAASASACLYVATDVFMNSEDPCISLGTLLDDAMGAVSPLT